MFKTIQKKVDTYASICDSRTTHRTQHKHKHMRTKALLLTAALGFAGVATSMAQAVYSVNVVGYINLTMKPGFNLVANQLKASPNNKLDSVLPAAPLESQVLKFVSGNYTTDISDGSTWIDNATGVPSTTTVAPGEGFFFFNPAATDSSATLVGEVTTGNGLNVPLAAGFNLVSSIVPQQIALTAANGFPQALEVQYLSFNPATQNYNTTLINDGAGWLNNETGDPVAAPAPAVGQGFFIFNPGSALAWTRNFNPNN
jgi:hypothetical protein